MVAGSLTFTPEIYNLTPISIAQAKVQLYNGIGEDYASEIESQEIAKLRAKAKAIRVATEKAGVYLKNYSHSINSVLQDDEITAIAVNSYKIVGDVHYDKTVNHVGDVHYDKTVNQLSDNVTVIVWKATVNVNVDDAEIQNWLKRDFNDKLNIVTQTNEAIKADEENTRKVEYLRKRVENAKIDKERNNIKVEYEQADNEFLVNQLVDEGLRLAYQGDYNGAIAKYNKALHLNPNSYRAYGNRGNAYSDLRQYKQAIEDYNKIITMYPNLAYTAYICLGNVYSDLQNYNEAINDYTKSIELISDEALSYCNRGTAYAIGLKNYNAAIVDFSKAIELNPNFAEAYSNRGLAYYNLRNYNQAIDDYNKAILLNPDDAEAYYNRGLAYYNLRNYNQAIDDYNKTIELNPDYIAYNSRGIVYKRLGNIKQAIDDFNKAIQLNPDYIEVYINRGVVYGVFLEDYSQAIADFNKVIQLNPDYALAYHLRGLCYKELGENDKAQEDFAKAKELGYNG